MSRSPQEAVEDGKIDALRDAVDALKQAVIELTVDTTLVPENGEVIGYDLAAVYRHLGRVTAKAQELHPMQNLAVGVLALLSADRQAE